LLIAEFFVFIYYISISISRRIIRERIGSVDHCRGVSFGLPGIRPPAGPEMGLIRSEGFHTQEPAYAGEFGNPNGLLRQGC
jgi:hypothetical protein